MVRRILSKSFYRQALALAIILGPVALAGGTGTRPGPGT